MTDVELRWIVPKKTPDDIPVLPVLQERTRHEFGRWSEWHNVPVERVSVGEYTTALRRFTRKLEGT